MRSMLVYAAALVVPVAAKAAPSDVNAHSFYADAKALEAKGMAAMFDKRLKPMTGQMKDAGARTRSANLAAKAAGKPIYCPPEGARRSINSRKVIALLGRIPESERRTLTLAEAWRRAMASEFPCR